MGPTLGAFEDPLALTVCLVGTSLDWGAQAEAGCIAINNARFLQWNGTLLLPCHVPEIGRHIFSQRGREIVCFSALVGHSLLLSIACISFLTHAHVELHAIATWGTRIYPADSLATDTKEQLRSGHSLKSGRFAVKSSVQTWSLLGKLSRPWSLRSPYP